MSGELAEIARLARPLDDAADLDPLVERVGDARFVLVGEASHGTSEYYTWRARLTKRLVAEKGFDLVAVEGDWPDCFEVNCWVKGSEDSPRSARDVLTGFARWPTWMWANEEVADFTSWLREHNERTGSRVGFYGLDVYSLWDSIDRVLGYLSEHEPDAVGHALAAARCFDPYARDPQRYAWAARMLPASCEDAVVAVLSDLRSRAGRPRSGPVPGVAEDEFDALQNAEVVAGAERYYRTMVRGDAESWNVRDCHMVDTLDRLVGHHGPGSRAVVWEHNTHIGDARATDMASAGMVNVGQVVRDRHADEGVVLVGLGGYSGSVIAAPAWGDTMRQMRVPPARDSSHEALMHEAVRRPALFVFDEGAEGSWLTRPRGHRAIGVVYDPERDPMRNWVPTVLGDRYDAFMFFPETEALHPLRVETPAAMTEPETYPFSV